MPQSHVREALRLYLVTMDCDGLTERVGAAVASGVTMVQLRLKGRLDCDIVAVGRSIARICGDAGIPFIVNDRLDIAIVLEADGVHLGVDDLPVADARRIGGPGFIVGFSPETDDQIAGAQTEGADYLGIGPFFATATKGDAGVPLGPAEFLRRRRLTPLPVVAIGGIDATNASQPFDAGADGIAVASAILGAADSGATTARLLGTVAQ